MTHTPEELLERALLLIMEGCEISREEALEWLEDDQEDWSKPIDVERN